MRWRGGVGAVSAASSLVLLGVLAAEARAYDLNVEFRGLVSFVPIDRTTSGTDAARELWVLMPDATDPRSVRKLEKVMRHYYEFQAGFGVEHSPHYPFLKVRAADLSGAGSTVDPKAWVFVALSAENIFSPDEGHPSRYDLMIEPDCSQPKPVVLEDFRLVSPVKDGQGLAHSCSACASWTKPLDVNSTQVPLVGRTMFHCGETAAVTAHVNPHPGVESQTVAEKVTLTRTGISGATTIRLRAIDGTGDKQISLTPPAGDNLDVEIVNLTAQELLGMPHEPPPSAVEDYFHFKLFYLIAPKAADGFVWSYDSYWAPGFHRNGDPFCTPPSQLLP